MKNKNNIKDTILNFYSAIRHDPNHRFKSWEHCYRYFTQTKVIDEDIASLHLAFYLASWGMYRGSSFLLWKDYKVHQQAVSLLINEIDSLKNLNTIDENTDVEKLSEHLALLIKRTKEAYESQELHTQKGKEVKISNTLATKIVLGVLGCVPAYDRFFIDGLKIKNLKPYSPNANGIKVLISFYKENLEQFEEARAKIKEYSKVDYSPMKLLDMYFWQIGFIKNLRNV